MANKWRVVEQIPRTDPRTPAELVKLTAIGAKHQVVPFGDLVTGKTIHVGAELVRIVSDFPVAIWLDGGLLNPADMTLDDLNSANNTDIRFSPAFDVTIRRPVRDIRLQIPWGDALSISDLTQKYLAGQVHIWYARGPIDSLDFGLPVSFGLKERYAVLGSSDFYIGPIWPTYNGDNATSPNGLLWAPCRLELWGIEWDTIWSSTAGVYTTWDIMWCGDGGNVAAFGVKLRCMIPNTADGREEFSVPVIVPGGTLRETTPSLLEGLYLHGVTTHYVSQIDIALNFRGWF